MTVLILIAIALLFIIDVIVFSYEKYEWSIAVMVGTIALAYFGTPHVKEFIEHAGWLSIFTKYLPGYLVLGLGTAVVKWSIFSFKHIGKIKKLKAKFDASEASSPTAITRAIADFVPEHRRGEWTPEAAKRAVFVRYFGSNLEYGDPSKKHIYDDADYKKETAVVDALTPRAKENVGVIAIWVFQWPIVIVSMLLSDLLVKVIDTAAAFLDVLFSAISRKRVAGATKGL